MTALSYNQPNLPFCKNNVKICYLKKEPLVSILDTRGLSLFIVCLAIYTCNAYFALIAAWEARYRRSSYPWDKKYYFSVEAM